MSENPLGNESKLKLKLKNTDTNRFKVATGRMQKLSTPDEAAEQQEVAPQDGVVNKASVTQPISDPLSLRDTATGKLKRITDTEAASALAPAAQRARRPQGAKRNSPPEGRALGGPPHRQSYGRRPTSGAAGDRPYH